MGLFSLLDVIMSRPIDEILAEISVEDDIIETLTGTPSPMLQMLTLVIALEKGEWDQVSQLAMELQLEESSLAPLYLDAVKWAQEIYRL